MKTKKSGSRGSAHQVGAPSAGAAGELPERASEAPGSREVPLPLPRVRPLPKSELVSQQMSRMPRQNTKPELALRRELHARGLRFRIHPALPGRPDVAFTRAKIAVFVDGCFWHGCAEHGTLPKNNREWWRAKIAGNLQRDRAKDEALAILGWDVLHFWEHETPEAAAALVEETWRRKTLRPRVEP
jgi:DNA mismatch endonuclease (patch repair protein)